MDQPVSALETLQAKKQAAVANEDYEIERLQSTPDASIESELLCTSSTQQVGAGVTEPSAAADDTSFTIPEAPFPGRSSDAALERHRRSSQRQKFRPLAYWKGERVNYRRSSSAGEAADGEAQLNPTPEIIDITEVVDSPEKFKKAVKVQPTKPKTVAKKDAAAGEQATGRKRVGGKRKASMPKPTRTAEPKKGAKRSRPVDTSSAQSEASKLGRRKQTVKKYVAQRTAPLDSWNQQSAASSANGSETLAATTGSDLPKVRTYARSRQPSAPGSPKAAPKPKRPSQLSALMAMSP